MIQNPIDDDIVAFIGMSLIFLTVLGTHGINWITTDCGQTVKALNSGKKVEEFLFHPI
jgi:hypothetical protein